MSSAVRELVSYVAEGAVPGSAPLRAVAPSAPVPVSVDGTGDPRPPADVLAG